MANWFNTTIRLHHGNDNAISAFNSLQLKILEVERSNIQPIKSEMYFAPFVEIFPEFKGTDLSESLGANHCNFSADSESILMESASAYPNEAVLKIVDFVFDADPAAIISSKFTEETYEVVGYELFSFHDVIDEEVYSIEDLIDDKGVEIDEDEGIGIEAEERIHEILENEIKDAVNQFIEDRENGD